MNDGRKRKGQKHQNKTAFKIQFDPLAQEVHKKVSFRDLCKRCVGQIQWKIQYNKYKKMTEPARCNFCQQKNVLRTYMRACQACSHEKHVCPKCLGEESEEQIETHLNELEQKKQDQQTQKKMNDFLKTLKERSRRTVKRQYEKGTIEWNSQMNNFVDHDGNTLSLKFKQGCGDQKQEQGEENNSEGDEQGNQSDIDSNESQQKDSETEQKQQKQLQQKQQKKSNKKMKKEEVEQKEQQQVIEDHYQSEKEQQAEDKEQEGDFSGDKKEESGVNEKQKQEIEVKKEIQQGQQNQEDWSDIEQDTEDIVKQPHQNHLPSKGRRAH